MFLKVCFKTTSIIFFFLHLISQAQNVPIGSWRTHLKHNEAYKVAEYNGKMYFITTSLVSYNPLDGNLKVLSKAEGFSDSEPVLIEPSVQNNLLMIVYKNGNIDILKDNSIINLSDIKRKSTNLSKPVNQIYFYENYAYLACSFGVVILDLNSLLFLETYSNLGQGGDQLDVKSIVIKKDSIYIASNKGMFSANKNAANLHDYLSWKRLKIDTLAPDAPVTKLVDFNDTLYLNTDTLFYSYAGGKWTKLPFFGISEQLRPSAEELFVLLKNGYMDSYQKTNFILFWKNKKNYKIKKQFELTFVHDCIAGSDGNYWLAVGGYGLLKMDKNKKMGENFLPNGAATYNYTNMSSWEDELMVIFNDYFSVFKNGIWSNYRFRRKLTNSSGYVQIEGFEYLGPEYITFYGQISLLKSGDAKVFLGSSAKGLLVRDENGLINSFNDSNSIFKNTEGQTLIQDIQTDLQNNIWFINNGTSAPLVVKTPDNTWYNFKTYVGSEIKHLKKMVIDQNGSIWTSAEKVEGLLIFNHNNTFDDINDDQWKYITSFSGEGRTVEAMAVDLDNHVWIGTEDGITVFYSPELIFDEKEFSGNCPVFDQRCLLSGQRINCILVDSNNRKWIGTRSGAYLFNEDGTDQIYHFNIENSPLLSNNVKQISIVTTTGEVFFNTDKGIVSYRSTATKSYEDPGFLNVFPNPVLPGYEGLIAISGLPFRATVKITDIAGKLVFETRAEGGTAIWNGSDSNQRKVQTGVYLIFISKEDGTEMQVTKIAFIN